MVKGVFDDDNLTLGWDGRANGGKDPAQMDVYVWVIRTTDNMDKEHQYIGHVTLVR